MKVSEVINIGSKLEVEFMIHCDSYCNWMKFNSDFGLSRLSNTGVYQKFDKDAPIPVRWAAPEVLYSGTYSSKVTPSIFLLT
jgi:hypothetical protein